jgi:hypothetical protein
MAKVTYTKAGNLQLSPHFWLAELTVSEVALRRGIENIPDNLAMSNLFKLASLLEQVRAALGNKAVVVSSGYRGPALNSAIGGSKTSEHMTGCAADFHCPAFGSTKEICQAIIDSGIKFGQLIQEGGRWVHISLPDGTRDGEVLTAHFVNGRVKYTRGLT